MEAARVAGKRSGTLESASLYNEPPPSLALLFESAYRFLVLCNNERCKRRIHTTSFASSLTLALRHSALNPSPITSAPIIGLERALARWRACERRPIVFLQQMEIEKQTGTSHCFLAETVQHGRRRRRRTTAHLISRPPTIDLPYRAEMKLHNT